MSHKLTTSKTPTAPGVPAVKATTSPTNFDALSDGAFIRQVSLTAVMEPPMFGVMEPQTGS